MTGSYEPGMFIRKRCKIQTLERCNCENVGRTCILIQYNIRNITNFKQIKVLNLQELICLNGVLRDM